MKLHRSLKHEYEIYVQEEIDFYKDSLPRSTLLSIGDEAVAELLKQSQLSLTEVLVREEVDRIICRRLRLPSYSSWRRRRVKMLEKCRSPEHWNLSPDDALVREIRPSEEGHVLLASPTREGPALYLAANGCDVTAVDEEPQIVRRLLTAAGAAGLAVRGYVASIGDWSPDVSLSAVVCTGAAFANLSAGERDRVIALLQRATVAGGVHLVESFSADGATLSIEELRARYRGWSVTVDGGRPGATPTFIARKSA